MRDNEPKMYEITREFYEISVDCWSYAFNKPRPTTDFMTIDDLQLFAKNLMNNLKKAPSFVQQRADDFINAKLQMVSEATQERNMN